MLRARYGTSLASVHLQVVRTCSLVLTVPKSGKAIMKTILAINTRSRDVLLPQATATVACTVFVSCEWVKLHDGMLVHTRRHYTIPAEALRFFDADVRSEQWLAA